MRILAFSALALGLGLSVVHVTACSNSADDCNATATCGATAGASHAGSAGKSGGGDGTDAGASNGGSSQGGSSQNGGNSGTTGAGGEGGGPNACTGDVSDDAACWTTNELGVFVSSDAADDSGNGTKEAPFKTIAKGIAAAAGKNVYVCVGATDYTEKVSLDLASDGIRIYGGFECANWTYATTRSAQVLSPSNIALRIDALKKGAHIENVSFQAADATGTGADASSYGAFVTGSKGVVFTRVELKAGAGKAGPDGAAGGTTEDAAPAGPDQNGKPALCTGTLEDADGGKWDAPVCGSRGGEGGKAIVETDGNNGASGTPATGVDPLNAVNRGLGSSVAGEDAQPGTKGSKGNPGPFGLAAAEAGKFIATGYTGASGNAGGNGFPGQGGGGGGASKSNATCRGASGGAGGLGGCGGKPGAGGQGGGASVGLFAWSSAIALSNCSVASAAGGAGGAGGKAGGGGSGGSGGAAGLGNALNSIGLSGQGGFGGNGGPGGNGSGGTGGPSYALVYSSGAKPTYEAANTTLKTGTPGAAGVGGQQVSTTKAPDGSAGVAAPEFEIP